MYENVKKKDIENLIIEALFNKGGKREKQIETN